MTIRQVRQLRAGDEVTWNDPDEGACTDTFRILTIREAQRGSGVFIITKMDGSVLEAFARELS